MISLTVSNDPNKKFRKELNSGIVSMVLLSIMTQAKDPMYGYQIAKDLEEKGEEVQMMKQGALYPVLRSLAASGLLQSHVDPSITGPPRRYYQITDSGRQTLLEWETIWDETKTYIDNIIGEKNV